MKILIHGAGKTNKKVMELSDYRFLLEQLEADLTGWSRESCTDLLAALERVRVSAWSQVVKGAQSLSSQDNRQLLTLPQVAERLAVPETYAYELARQNRLPVVRLGKYVRVSAEEFEKWLAQQASLERRIDREPSGFHSAGGRKGAVKRIGRSTNNDRASSKSQPKTSMGFRPPPVSIPGVAEPGAAKPELPDKEG
jgi:excisionase family DNA binding protein